MNTKMLVLAGLVLATPACTVSQEEMESVEQDALAARANLKAKSYLSKEIFEQEQLTYNADGTLIGSEMVKVRHRLRFLPAGIREPKVHVDGFYYDYRYDGKGDMEYETRIETIKVSDGKQTAGADSTFYAKRQGAAKFKLFDCDSTSNCFDKESSQATIEAYTTKKGVQSLRLTGLRSGNEDSNDIYLETNGKNSIEFVLEN
jgi:hypothetical protein